MGTGTYSRLSFGRVIARTWGANTNEFGAEPEVCADVFVFSAQACKDPQRYDALDLSQWEFYVVAVDRVREWGYKNVSIAWVRKHAGPVPFSDLAVPSSAPGAAAAKPHLRPKRPAPRLGGYDGCCGRQIAHPPPPRMGSVSRIISSRLTKALRADSICSLPPILTRSFQWTIAVAVSPKC